MKICTSKSSKSEAISETMYLILKKKSLDYNITSLKEIIDSNLPKSDNNFCIHTINHDLCSHHFNWFIITSVSLHCQPLLRFSPSTAILL